MSIDAEKYLTKYKIIFVCFVWGALSSDAQVLLLAFYSVITYGDFEGPYLMPGN